MIVRDLNQKPQQEQQEFAIEGEAVNKIEYEKGDTQPYVIWLKTGKYVRAKGHTQFESLTLDAWRVVGSHSRIRRHGEFGSTIS